MAALAVGSAGCQTVHRVPGYERIAAPVAGPHGHGADAVALAPPPASTDPPPAPPGLEGPQPVDAYIRRALCENRMVLAARSNVLALRERIPQVTSLDDPVVSNTFFPSASNGLQTADGFMPWNLLVAQQFPWFGTLRLRGEAAHEDVKVALAELAAAQLDAVEAVKRAYHDLAFNERADAILRRNRALVEDFIEDARIRYRAGVSRGEQELLRSEVALADLDRELIAVEQGLAEARAALAQQVHVSPEADLRTVPTPPGAPPALQIERLYALAAAARPELQGRLAAVSRDVKAVELARKRSRPDVTLGVNYMLMTRDGAVAPNAMGNDNIGMFVGFNLPVYRSRIAAAVGEAQARAVADANLLEAERDAAFREIKELFAQAGAQRRTLELFRGRILPRSLDALELARNDFRAGAVDYVTVIASLREVLDIELQVARYEAELGKTLASLERAVGVQLAESPPPPGARVAAPDSEPPPPGDAPGPFGPGGDDDRVGPGADPAPHIEPIPAGPPDPPGLGG
jgi:outer membrane protein TolC